MCAFTVQGNVSSRELTRRVLGTLCRGVRRPLHRWVVEFEVFPREINPRLVCINWVYLDGTTSRGVGVGLDRQGQSSRVRNKVIPRG